MDEAMTTSGVRLVDGRVPLPTWEGEVMLRASAYVAGIKAALLLLSGTLRFSPRYEVLAAGCLIALTPWFLLRRREWARFLLLGAVVISLLIFFPWTFLGMGGRGLRIWLEHTLSPVGMLSLVVYNLPYAFLIYTMLSPEGVSAFRERQGEPLATLGSVSRVSGSLRGWLSLAMVLLAGASFAWTLYYVCRV